MENTTVTTPTITTTTTNENPAISSLKVQNVKCQFDLAVSNLNLVLAQNQSEKAKLRDEYEAKLHELNNTHTANLSESVVKVREIFAEYIHAIDIPEPVMPDINANEVAKRVRNLLKWIETQPKDFFVVTIRTGMFTQIESEKTIDAVKVDEDKVMVRVMGANDRGKWHQFLGASEIAVKMNPYFSKECQKV